MKTEELKSLLMDAAVKGTLADVVVKQKLNGDLAKMFTAALVNAFVEEIRPDVALYTNGRYIFNIEKLIEELPSEVQMRVIRNVFSYLERV